MNSLARFTKLILILRWKHLNDIKLRKTRQTRQVLSDMSGVNKSWVTANLT